MITDIPVLPRVAPFLAIACSAFALQAGSYRVFGPPRAGRVRPPLQINATPAASVSYTPAQIRHAYGFDQVSATGAGQKLAIVVAYGNPSIQSDLNTFCSQYGLSSTTIQVLGNNTGGDTGWALEAALDIEWSHAIAPGATLILSVAASNSGTDLLNAVDAAVNAGATVVSMSWGGNEFFGMATYDTHFNRPNVTFTASSGDSGAGVEWPAASPYVVAVGGTTLHLDANNNRSSETGWSGSGGGASAFYAKPGYQNGWQTSIGRGVPDVSLVADPNTGVRVYDSVNGGWFVVGGTSASAPQWAGLVTLANQLRAGNSLAPLGAPHARLYSLAQGSTTTPYTINTTYYFDVSSGSNGGYTAAPKYDFVTGLGSPVANQLVPALAPAPPTPPPAPTGLTAAAQNTEIDLQWNPSSGALSYIVSRGTTSGGPYTAIASGLASTSYHDTSSALVPGTTYYYVVAGVNSAGTGPNSTPASAALPLPAMNGYVTGVTLGTLRNEWGGWVGMQIVVGSTALSVNQLGRLMAPGNTQTHTVKVVDASTGFDVPGASVNIAMNGATLGQFKYATLSAPITLNAGNTYWILSQETAGGDSWYNWDTQITTTSVASDNAVAWGFGPGTWQTITVANRAFVPLDFTYTPATPPPPPPPPTGGYVTGLTLGTLRNEWGGWVGMQIVVGSTALSVNQLGRLMAPGNTQTHTVKVVDASTGLDVPGGAVNIAMNGGTLGQFKYATLSTPITLNAGATYWILSQETAGGDSWYNWDTQITTTSVATDNAVAWGNGPGTWQTIAVANRAFVPLDFTYTPATPPPPPTGGYVTGLTLGALRNEWGGWVGMQIVVGSTALSVNQLGRLMAPGNTQAHTVKVVDASTGLDVPGAAVNIAMNGGTLGQFKYATLSTPITLNAGAAYWILSQETAGGDSWYNWDTQITTTSVATDNAVVWGFGPGTWQTITVANQAFVPVDFTYVH